MNAKRLRCALRAARDIVKMKCWPRRERASSSIRELVAATASAATTIRNVRQSYRLYRFVHTLAHGQEERNGTERNETKCLCYERKVASSFNTKAVASFSTSGSSALIRWRASAWARTRACEWCSECSSMYMYHTYNMILIYRIEMSVQKVV